MKISEFRKLIREEVRKVIKEAKVSKTILGIDFNVVPIEDGLKFVFKDAKQFRKSGIYINVLVDEIIKMLNNKFGKNIFTFIPAGRLQDDPTVNGLEFRTDVENLLKRL